MRRILVANRGEIARRVVATARRLGLETVAVHSEPDAAAPHVREATLAFALGGRSAADSYLRADRLLEAARATGADAVHPGYGFLSEDARFAQAVQDAGLAWIGPPPAAMRALGSKAAAKALARAHGVPCLPGHAGADQRDERFAAEAARIGYPVMVKAVAAGGGRGMRRVEHASQLAAALAGARSEALAAFGDAELLIEPALRHPRHVEVQVFADAHGRAIHLGERDCSVQRRHQKLIEESPAPGVDAALRERMGACAVALARAAGYFGAGTVEFLLEGGEFFLMEMNTRLQVEHPVTEALTGLDLVEWQIRVARGEPLPLAQDEVRLAGHAVEVRLCAEDERFHPQAGVVRHFRPPGASAFAPGALRFDHAIDVGTEVTPHYDALLGKLVAHAPTRAAALDRLATALVELELLGLPTNRAFLAECLRDEAFRAGGVPISFLDGAAAALRARLHERERTAHARWGARACLGPDPAPLACAFAAPRRLRHRGETSDLSVRTLSAGGWEVTGADGARRVLRVDALEDGAARIAADGVAQRVCALCAPAPPAAPPRWHLQADGIDWWVDDVSFEPAAAAAASAATELRAPFNGRVVRVAARPGQTLAAGAPALVIESMKLEHGLGPSADAVVEQVLVSEGQQVAPGQLLLRLAAPARPA